MPSKEELFDLLKEKQEELGQLRWEYWREYVFLSFAWWFLIVSLVIFLLLWWHYVDRSRLKDILLFGMSLLVLTIFLDILGSELNLWDYPAMVLPWGARLICVDLIIPLGFMVVFQLTDRWLTFIMGSFAVAGVYAFILEPIAIWIDVYDPIVWKFWYSFPIYILLPMLPKWMIDKLTTLQANEGGEH
jgi:hypothetical protein